MKLSREKKEIILTKHFFERVLERNLFSSLEKASEITIKALKSDGILVKAYRKECDFYCIYETDEGIIVTAAVIDWPKHFLVSTIWEAESYHRKIYIKSKHKINEND